MKRLPDTLGPGLAGQLRSALLFQSLEQAFLRLRFLQHRQLIQRLQAQVIEELARRGEQRGPAHGFTMADDFHPATILKLLDDQAVDGHTANILDVAAGHRLTVGNDGQRLQRRTCVAGRFFRMQPVEIDAHLGAALKTPARRHLHKLHALLRPFLLQVQQQVLERIRAQDVIEKRA